MNEDIYLSEKWRGNVTFFEAYLNKLSGTKFEMIRCLGVGMSNKEISMELHITEATVKKYISEILLETELTNRTQIAVLFYIIQQSKR